MCVQVCEREYRQSQAEERCTDEIKFTYAWHLIKSQYKNDIRKGIRLMEELVTKGRDQRDYYYFTSLGHYKLEEFEEADSCVDRVLQMEPNNLQAKTLKQLITRKIRRDGLIGLGVLGGAALVGGVVAVGAVALAGLGISKLAKK